MVEETLTTRTVTIRASQLDKIKGMNFSKFIREMIEEHAEEYKNK